MMEIPRQDIIETKRFVDELNNIKYIHYRDLNPIVDETNFQICTKVDFKPVQGVYHPYEDIQEIWDRRKQLNKNNIIYEHQSKSGSEYFVSQDGNVYRMSDHWGRVKTCIWTLNGKGNMIASINVYGDMEIGVANLRDFQVIRQKPDRYKDYVINPLWIKEIPKIIDITNILSQLRNSQDFNNLPGEDKYLIARNFINFERHLKDFYSYKGTKHQGILYP